MAIGEVAEFREDVGEVAEHGVIVAIEACRLAWFEESSFREFQFGEDGVGMGASIEHRGNVRVAVTFFETSRVAQVTRSGTVDGRDGGVGDDLDLFANVAVRAREATVGAALLVDVVGVEIEQSEAVCFGVVAGESAELVAEEAVFGVLGVGGLYRAKGDEGAERRCSG
jgi:hypothetical protein